MNRIERLFRRPNEGILDSRLYDNVTFDRVFTQDLLNCRQELIIECPFITKRRVLELLPLFLRLQNRGVNITINTRPPNEQEPDYEINFQEAIEQFQKLGIIVLYTGGHHRKIAVIDRKITWEGSLNILSFNKSCEIMRRITSRQIAEQMITFLKLENYMGKPI